MAERAAYSRVYWSIIDDPKFDTVYSRDENLACWLRLLLIADQAWPASGQLPTSARVRPLAALVAAKLIDRLPNDRFRVHGLDAERNRRRQDAERIRGRNPDTQAPHALRARMDGAQVRAVDETRRDEPRKDETRLTAQSAKKGSYGPQLARDILEARVRE